MNSPSWKDIVRTVAPALGAALGTPAVGMAVKYIADAVLGDKEASQEDVEAALLGASPETLLKLKTADAEFKIQMRKLDIDVFALEQKDKVSARELFKANMWPQVLLSSLFVGCYFIVLYQLISGEIFIEEGVKDMVLILVGILTREVPTIMQFWFGSSFGSKQKTTALQDLVK